MSNLMMAEQKQRIDNMAHEQMARFYRFAPSSDPIIQTPLLWDMFIERFEGLGGMTPELSKRIGFV